jgi:hypothetical protein
MAATLARIPQTVSRTHSSADEFFANEVDGKWSEIFIRMGFRPVNEPMIGSPENRPEATSEQIDACFRETYDYFWTPPDERQS